MSSSQNRIYEVFGVTGSDHQYTSKKESVILRISANSYMRKQNARPIQANEQLVKVELGYDSRIAKAMNVYLSPDSELYKKLDAVFDEYASNNMLDIQAVAVNQSRRT